MSIFILKNKDTFNTDRNEWAKHIQHFKFHLGMLTALDYNIPFGLTVLNNMFIINVSCFIFFSESFNLGEVWVLDNKFSI